MYRVSIKLNNKLFYLSYLQFYALQLITPKPSIDMKKLKYTVEMVLNYNIQFQGGCRNYVLRVIQTILHNLLLPRAFKL